MNKPGLLESLWTLFVVLIGSPILWGLCAVPMWRWFVAPLLHAPTPSVAWMIGLSMTFGMFRGYQTDNNIKNWPDGWRQDFYLRFVLLAPISLGVGWIVHRFV